MNGRLCTLGLLLVTVAYGSFLVWQEWGFRQSRVAPMLVVSTIATPPSPAPLDTTAVATVLGLTAGATLLASAEPLTLQASFVLATGLSRALLADAQGSRIYQVGDPLPGGSVLRRVEADRAVLWNKGREEVLTLQTSATQLLRRFDPQAEAPAPATSAHFLRPLSGPSE
ncbi:MULTISPECIES: type II secretion system protein N [unclassified Pseudomonas]|uniref:type II secretion system protein N n=2 Tax=unclassified Pseudomonas TaxID=196821 RepID=UPI001CC1A660|nr:MULTISPECIES: type II secretion system protein N [unclassified Pseudomonas]